MNTKSMTKAQLIAKVEELESAVPTITCCDCGEPTVRKSLNQKRCPSCREAKEIASTEEYKAKKADPEKVAARAARKQWTAKKAEQKPGTGIADWNVPAGMSLTVALAEKVLVIDAKGNLGPAKGKAKAKTVAEKAAPGSKAVQALIDAGFTQEEAEELVASKK